MTMLLTILTLLSAATGIIAGGTTIVGGIPLDGKLPNFDLSLPVRANASLSPTSRVVLNHGERSAFIDAGGVFRIPDVEQGEHVLTVLVPGWTFPSLLITLDTEPHVQLLHPGKTPLPVSSPSLRYPIILYPIGKDDYYTVKGGLNIIGMMKNPIVLMMLFSGLMMFALPKIMASVESDPEMKREMAEARRRIAGRQNEIAGSVTNMLKGPPAQPQGRSSPAPRRKK